MKAKYILSLALAASMFTTSCDMDLAPVSTLEQTSAIQSVNDVKAFRNGLYSNVRGLVSSQFITLADIQMDMFNGLVVNGNRLGTIANGDVLSSDGDIYAYWAAIWARINNCNFLLEHAAPVYDKLVEANEEEKAAQVSLYMSEAYFLRGYYYALMFDRWCPAYTPELAESPALGLPIVTKYDPTSDRSAYPGRETMKKTIEFFLNDINLAYNGLKAWEEANPELVTSSSPTDDDGRLLPNAIYVSSMTCRALQARIALWLGDYANAEKYAEDVIKNGKYSMSTIESFANMWTQDTSTEIIFSPYESTNELGAAIGSTWLNNGPGQADYIPSSKLLAGLRAAGKAPIGLNAWKDVRYRAYITTRSVQSAYGTIQVPAFNKYPGNPSLFTSGETNYVNKPKPFRLTEMYFIVAEAAYNQGNQAKANETMKFYMSNRIKYGKDEAYVDLTGNELIQFIRTQKGLELVGEGFRMSDLRRWKVGFERADGIDYSNVGYKDGIDQILTAAGLDVAYTTTDHRYTWPIPGTEITSNPQMVGQQNPGY